MLLVLLVMLWLLLLMLMMKSGVHGEHGVKSVTIVMLSGGTVLHCSTVVAVVAVVGSALLRGHGH